jgi:hypothetical protein
MNVEIKRVIAWEMTEHPAGFMKNICCDCPVCHFEHFYTVPKGNMFWVVACERDTAIFIVVVPP